MMISKVRLISLTLCLALASVSARADEKKNAAFDNAASKAYLELKGMSVKGGRPRINYDQSIEANAERDAVDANPYLENILRSEPKPNDKTLTALRAVAQMVPQGSTSMALINAIRDRAEHIAGTDGSGGLDTDFLETRQHIHNNFSPAVLDETRAYLATHPDISDEAKQEIRILIKDLETMLEGGSRARGVVGNTNRSLEDSLNVARWSQTSLINGSSRGSTAEAVNNLNQSLADLFVHFGLPGNLPSPADLLPIGSLKSLIKTLGAEGLLKDKQEEEILAILDTTDGRDRSKDGLLRDYLKRVFAIAQEKLEKNLAWAKKINGSDENQSEFVQKWLRSSNLLRLSQWIEKLAPKNNPYEAASQGTRCGTLRVVGSLAELDRLATNMRDILAVVSDKPIEVTRKTPFGGLITTNPMTEGSHAVILCRNMQRPCASAVMSKAEIARLKSLDGTLVRFDVGSNSYTLDGSGRIPGYDDAANFFALKAAESAAENAPEGPKIPLVKDLSVSGMQDMKTKANAQSIGVKAANYFELNRFLGTTRTQPGMAIPFKYYTEFAEKVGVNKVLNDMLSDPEKMKRIRTDAEYRSARLKDLRALFKRKMPSALLKEIRAEIDKRFKDPKTRLKKLRFRSSSNSEDLQWFSGAGLYDSVGMETKAETTDTEINAAIEKSVKEVWASVWSDNAFEGRQEVSIDHRTVAMGVLIHPSYDEEVANGVALTGLGTENPDYYRVAVNKGSYPVTNPEDGVLPDVYEAHRRSENARKMIRYNNLSLGKLVLSQDEAADLRDMVNKIHEHFGEPMEIEFKLMPNPLVPGKNIIQVKQARPYRPKESTQKGSSKEGSKG